MPRELMNSLSPTFAYMSCWKLSDITTVCKKKQFERLLSLESASCREIMMVSFTFKTEENFNDDIIHFQVKRILQQTN